MLVPQMILVDEPPRASASEVLGSKFENVAASELGISSRTGKPFSSTKSRRRLLDDGPRESECMSPRLEALTVEAPGPVDREDRTKRPLLLLGMSDRCCAGPLRPPFNPRVGLELEAYRIGDESRLP